METYFRTINLFALFSIRHDNVIDLMFDDEIYG